MRQKHSLSRTSSSPGAAYPAKAISPALCAFLLPLVTLSAGCARLPPSISVVGAYFPDWVFCITGGIIAMALVRAVLERTRIGSALELRVILYSALSAIFSCLFWLIFF